MKYVFNPTGICARSIMIEVENDKILSARFMGGCQGNSMGISALVEGMDVKEAISKLKGIPCGRRSTSCPDQLARALEKVQEDRK